ncbi:MAG: response regulator [Candidatus Firestonebacteria bacterium]|nr:response regulator [Candidatus Firestonebacteria bacterium]
MNNKANILIIDDELMPRYSIKMVLKEKYNVFIADGGVDGLNLMNQNPADLVVLDLRMPDMDGITVLREIKGKHPETEVVLLTAHATIDSARNALRLGAFDYLMKPFDKDDLLNVVERGLRKKNDKEMEKMEKEGLKDINKNLEDEIAGAREKLLLFYEGTVKALIRTIDAKDHYTYSHSEHVAKLSFLIAEVLGLSDTLKRKLKQSPIIHDIGKIGIEEIILKKKGPLSSEEFVIIKKHPDIGARIVQPVPFLEDVVPIILYHHERFDGNGYPRGLKGEEIPIEARIVAVADAVDAMLRKRPYREALPMERVLKVLTDEAGSQFDPVIVDIIISGKLVLE